MSISLAPSQFARRAETSWSTSAESLQTVSCFLKIVSFATRRRRKKSYGNAIEHQSFESLEFQSRLLNRTATGLKRMGWPHTPSSTYQKCLLSSETCSTPTMDGPQASIPRNPICIDSSTAYKSERPTRWPGWKRATTLLLETAIAFGHGYTEEVVG
jgi:hypothetical protein